MRRQMLPVPLAAVLLAAAAIPRPSAAQGANVVGGTVARPVAESTARAAREQQRVRLPPQPAAGEECPAEPMADRHRRSAEGPAWPSSSTAPAPAGATPGRAPGSRCPTLERHAGSAP